MRQRYSRYSTCFNLLFAAITCFLLFPPNLIAVDVTLRWDPNLEEDLAGYKIHYKEKSYAEPYDGQGADQGDSPIIVPLILIEDRDNPQYCLTGLKDNKIYFFAVTAYDQDDPPNESDYLNIMSNLLSMKSIPEYEIISLAGTNITDAVGNPLTPAAIAINDRDQDRMTDDWEVAGGLDPLLPNSGADADGDRFSNLREYQARTDLHDAASSPIAIVDSIPQPNAGILNSARVPDDTAFAVFIASVHGIDVGDPESIRFTVDDGKQDPYLRDLNSDTMRVVEVDTGSDLSLLWVVYDRSLETGLPMVYDHDANIHVSVEIEDVAGNILSSQHFEFNIESESENEQAWGNLPELGYYAPVNAVSGYNEGIEIVSGELAAARIEYDGSEPLTPIFGPIYEIEGVVAAGMEEVGAPLNLLPHTVFNKPVKVFIPAADGFDITKIGIYYHNGVEWLPACDKYGNLLPGAEGWMVAGSRVNHMENSPPLIEIQVYHFSAVQGGVIVNTTGTSETTDDRVDTGGSGAVVVVKCFIDTTAYDAKPAFGLLALLWVLGMLPLNNCLSISGLRAA